MQPLISVIIATYNREKYLKLAIDSVRNQTYSNIQLIVVDDGSEDNTAGLVKSIADPRVEYYPMDKNRHVASALNHGLTQVRGDYIAILDSDDLYEPDKLQKQMEFLRQYPEYKVCFTKPIFIDENGSLLEDKEFTAIFDVANRPQAEWLQHFFFRNNCFAHDTVLMKREVLDSIGGYNYCYVQLLDFDLWLRIIKKYPIYIIDEPLVKIRRFSDTAQNISGHTETVYIRSDNEISLIYRHFFDDMDDGLFLRAFREFFRNPEASNAIELECEKAFLLGKKGTTELMLEKLVPLLNKEESRNVLEQIYHFTPKDFYRLNAGVILNNQQVQLLVERERQLAEQVRLSQEANAQMQRQNASLEENIAFLQSDKEKLQVQIQEIYHSHSWKLSAPVRWADRLIAKMFGKK